jgi:hypothetical protein
MAVDVQEWHWLALFLCCPLCRDSMGRSDESGDSLPAQKSWLVPSLLADNPVLVLAVAQQMRCPARAALQVTGRQLGGC